MQFKSLFFEDYYNSCFVSGGGMETEVKIGLLERFFKGVTKRKEGYKDE